MNLHRNKSKDIASSARRSVNFFSSPKAITSKPSFDLIRSTSNSNLILPKIQRSEIPKLHSPLPVLKSPSNSISTTLKHSSLPQLLASVKSNKPYGSVKLYCANTHRGIVREHNEDRVMILPRVIKPATRKDEKWPACSFFGLYDGHAGKNCSNFLRDNLHSLIINDSQFPYDPEQAILNGFAKAESSFLEYALKKGEKSGSCAVVLLVIGKQCYVGNLGDSRALVSVNHGLECVAMSRDHKPCDEEEAHRILKAGGEVYKLGDNLVSRILPGRLAISRAFGDIDAKVKDLGGNPNVLISIPEIKSFPITNNVDFICIGSDGIFDRLSNHEVVDLIWDKGNSSEKDALAKMSKGVERVLYESMSRLSYDNVSLLAVGFEGFINNIE